MLNIVLCVQLKSPWIVQEEAACLLYRRLKETSQVKQQREEGGSSSIILDLESMQSYLNQLVGEQSSPMALLVQGNNTNLGEQVVEMLDTALVSGIGMVGRGETEGKVVEASVAELLSKVLSEHRISNRPSSSSSLATLESMRMYTSIAGAIITEDACLPGKLTPLVRPLMKSFKNETGINRRSQTVTYMVKLLEMLARATHVSSFLRTRDKILNNICNAIYKDGFEEHAEAAIAGFSLVLQNLVGNLANHVESLKSLGHVWERIEPLSSSRDDAHADDDDSGFDSLGGLRLLHVVCGNLHSKTTLTSKLIMTFLSRLVVLVCIEKDSEIRKLSSAIVITLCQVQAKLALTTALPQLSTFMDDRENDLIRLEACRLLHAVVKAVGTEICPFVRHLLSPIMSLMADPVHSCANIANGIFAALVRVAPLVRAETSISWKTPRDDQNENASLVIDHLIHGKPFPPYH